MEKELLKLTLGFIVIGLFMAAVERLWPARAGQKFVRKGFRTDLIYWFVPPLCYLPFTPVAMSNASLALGSLLGVGAEPGSFALGFAFIGHQPLWAQAIEALFLVDLLSYLGHRLLHTRTFWPFHAVHHSPEELDWLSAVRNHPVNVIIQRLLCVFPVILIGYSPRAIAMLGPFFALYGYFVHANLKFDLWPLRKIFVSPIMHRWHHTFVDEGGDKNYGEIFAFWDVLFGTFYLPARKPERLGADEAIPESALGQMAWPFQRIFASHSQTVPAE